MNGQCGVKTMITVVAMRLVVMVALFESIIIKWGLTAM